MTREERILAVLSDYFYRMVPEEPEPPSAWDANYTLIALCGNRLVNYERAWQLPFTMMERTGYEDPLEMCRALTVEELEAAIRVPPCGHRMPRRVALAMHGTARAIAEDYSGDARTLYHGQPLAVVQERLGALSGYGRKLSRLAMLIILFHWGGEVGEGILDCAPDLHVCRVLHRLGLIAEPDPELALQAARKLSPLAYYLADGAFGLGTTLCGAKPACGDCPLHSDCPLGTKRPV